MRDINTSIKLKEKCKKYKKKICYVVFYPLIFLYELYEPSKLRKWIKTKKYYREMKNSLFRDLINYGSLIFTDCFLSMEHSDFCDIISTYDYNTYYNYRYYADKNDKELLDDILSIFKKCDCVKIQEVKPKEIFKYIYKRYEGEKFYRVTTN